jgi:multicomponent Na+:H+ antiporter subunit D
VFTLLFVGEDGQAQWAHQLILVLAGVTMLTGVLGAVAQHDFRRILSWNIVSGIGYMILGIGLFTRLALTGTVFCLVHHVIVKTNLFLVSGVANRLRGSYELKRLGGLYHDHPGLAILFLLPAMSLAGVPPLSGFFAKLILVKASLEIEQFAAAAVALLVGLLTLYSMTTIWAEAFWKPLSEDTPPRAPLTAGSKAVLLAPIVVLTALTVAIGLAGQPLFELSQQAADQLLDRQGYIDAVLPGYSVNR